MEKFCSTSVQLVVGEATMTSTTAAIGNTAPASHHSTDTSVRLRLGRSTISCAATNPTASGATWYFAPTAKPASTPRTANSHGRAANCSRDTSAEATTSSMGRYSVLRKLKSIGTPTNHVVAIGYHHTTVATSAGPRPIAREAATNRAKAASASKIADSR